MTQMFMWGDEPVAPPPRRLPAAKGTPSEAEPLLGSYDLIVVAFSGGKDSMACLLHLFDQGIPRQKIELWHHDVDGSPGDPRFMDWPITRAYCGRVAAQLEVPIRYSWKHGGFLGEMFRDRAPTPPTSFETPSGVMTRGGKSGKLNTRLRFPQVSGDLNTRWCSSYLKIDVGTKALANDPRFRHKRTLFVTGERAEESPKRSTYRAFEPDRADARRGRHKRHVDRWRPVHKWTEENVWEIIRRYGVRPHPAYELGWGRLSCAGCIFGSENQFASLRAVLPAQFEMIAGLEEQFGVTIKRELVTVRQLADAGQVYPASRDARLVQLAASEHWPEHEPVVVDPRTWSLPAGAYGESVGPS